MQLGDRVILSILDACIPSLRSPKL